MATSRTVAQGNGEPAPELSQGLRKRLAVRAYQSQVVMEPQRGLRASDIMSSPALCVRAHQTLAEVGDLLERFPVRHLPVTDAEESLVGIMSQRDLLGYRARGVKLDQVQVSEAMTREVLTTRREASVREAARVMLDARVGALPVVDASGKVLGILTRSDILQAVVERAPFDAWG